ncbi:MAG: glycoside hydrolase family 3 C-terminal domain-containing protein [Acidobacteriota bacterium]|nr:glycoside hydrolase family 3 C-terminal domain-containing protein [Acidobacteriota bacterium]
MPRFHASHLNALNLAVVVLLVVSAQTALAQDQPIYKDRAAGIEDRVNDLLQRLTLEEKLELLGGTGFATKAIERLDLPPMAMCDGPIGVRGGEGGTQGPATAFPCGIAMAATWDPAIVQRIGEAIGREVQNKGIGASVILGPCVNIHRTPQGGRNGESYSEDPHLAARMAVAYVRGVQSTGAAACVKHYACNNQEYERGTINVRVDERALREIYLPAFQAAVEEADAWCVMNAYNKVNGPYCSANSYLLNDVLKGDFGFDGCVMTDWGAAHNSLGVALGGTDLEMPTGAHMNPARLLPLIEGGKVSREIIDDKVRRILRTVVRVGLLDGPKEPDNSIVNCQAHRDLVREAGARAIVLLKNEGNVLPLDAAALRSIAVIGPNAAENRLGMGGSGYVYSTSNTHALDCIKARVGENVTVNYARGGTSGDETLPAIPSELLSPAGGGPGEHGLKAEYFANQSLEGQPALVRTDASVDFDWGGNGPGGGLPSDHFSVRWTGTFTPAVSGEYFLGIASDDGSRLFLDGKQIAATWRDHAVEAERAKVALEAGRGYEIRLEYYENTGLASMTLGMLEPGVDLEKDPAIEAAVQAAAKSDVAVVVAGLSASHESEGRDRDNLELPGNQAALIKAVAAANPKTVVVLSNGTPLMMADWIEQVPAVLEAWYLGEGGGLAVTDVLFGDVNPSGKLPDTLAVRREDYPDSGNYPGGGGVVDYAEGIYVGYRHFDKNGVEPLYPFGFGLSYTTFEYSDLGITPGTLQAGGKASVSLTVRNTGTRAGEEVVQVYVHDPAPRIDKPVRELKGFTRVALEPGEAKRVTLELGPDALAYCDVPGKQWRADAGTYELQVGASSRDIRLRGNVVLGETVTWPVANMGKWIAEAAPDWGPNFALKQPVQVSSVERDDTPPEAAVDDSLSTRWSSEHNDPQWIMVDLGQVRTINRVVLRWETAFGSAYTLEVSTDGANWKQVYATQTGMGDEESIAFEGVDARYVRLSGTKRGTPYGYSLYDFAVFGPR